MSNSKNWFNKTRSNERSLKQSVINKIRQDYSRQNIPDLLDHMPQSSQSWQSIRRLVQQNASKSSQNLNSIIQDLVNFYLIAFQEIPTNIERFQVSPDFTNLLYMTLSDCITNLHPDTSELLKLTKWLLHVDHSTIQQAMEIKEGILLLASNQTNAQLCADAFEFLVDLGQVCKELQLQDTYKQITKEAVVKLFFYIKQKVNNLPLQHLVQTMVQKIISQDSINFQLYRELFVHMQTLANNLLQNCSVEDYGNFDHKYSQSALCLMSSLPDFDKQDAKRLLEGYIESIKIDFTHCIVRFINDLCVEFDFKQEKSRLGSIFQSLLGISRLFYTSQLQKGLIYILKTVQQPQIADLLNQQLPYIQVYCLQLVNYYMKNAPVRSGSRFEHMDLNELVALIFWPKMIEVTIQSDNANLREELSRQHREIISMLITHPTDVEALIKGITSSIQMHRERENYLALLQEKLSMIIMCENRDMVITYLENSFTIDRAFQSLQDNIQSKNVECVKVLLVMLYMLFDIGQLAQYVSRNDVIVERLFTMLQNGEDIDFPSICLSRIMKYSPTCDEIYKRYITLLAQEQNHIRVQILLQGIQRMLDSQYQQKSFIQKKLAEFKILAILGQKLQTMEEIELKAQILTTIRYILSQNVELRKNLSMHDYIAIKEGLTQINNYQQPSEVFNSLIDNLLYLLFDDTRLDGLENKMIKTIEVIPILLDMIFKETISVEILKCYLERLKQISQCKYNQCIFIQQGVVEWLFKSIQVVQDQECKDLIQNLLVQFGSIHLPPQCLINALDRMSDLDQQTQISLLRSLELISFQNFIHQSDKLMQKPNTSFYFWDSDIEITTQNSKIAPILPQKNFTISFWVNLDYMNQSQGLMYFEDKSQQKLMTVYFNKFAQLVIQCMEEKSDHYYIITSQRVDYNVWNHITISYQKINLFFNRNEQVIITINGKPCDVQEKGKSSLRKYALQQWCIGKSIELAQGEYGQWKYSKINLKGQITNIHIFQSALNEVEIQVIYQLGYNYEDHFSPRKALFQIEQNKQIKETIILLRQNIYAYWNSRFSKPRFPKQATIKLQDNSLHIITVSFVDSLLAAGGLKSLLKLFYDLRHLETEQLIRVINIISTVLQGQNPFIIDQIKRDHIPKIMSILIEEIGSRCDQHMFSSVFQLIQGIEWNRKIQTSFLRSLLLESSAWQNKDQQLQDSFLNHLSSILPTCYQNKQRIVYYIKYFISSSYFFRQAKKESSSTSLKVKYFTDMISECLNFSQDDLCDIATLAIRDKKYEDFDELFGLLESQIQVQNIKQAEDLKKWFTYILKLLEKYQDANIQSRIFKLFKRIAFQKQKLKASNLFSVTTQKTNISIEDTSRRAVYRGLLDLIGFQLVRQMNKNLFQDLISLYINVNKSSYITLIQQISKSNLLELITQRIPSSNEIQQILEYLIYILDTHPAQVKAFFDDVWFPRWLIELWNKPDIGQEQYLEDFTIIFFYKNFNQTIQSSHKLRMLIKHINNNDSVLNIIIRLLQLIQQEDSHNIDGIILRNFLELCFIVEDFVHSNSLIVPNPQYTGLVHSLILTAQNLGIVNFTLPQFPNMPIQQLRNILNFQPQPREVHEPLGREGGFVRVGIKLCLIGISQTQDSQQQDWIQLLRQIILATKQGAQDSVTSKIEALTKSTDLYTSVYELPPNQGQNLFKQEWFQAFYLVAELTNLLICKEQIPILNFLSQYIQASNFIKLFQAWVTKITIDDYLQYHYLLQNYINEIWAFHMKQDARTNTFNEVNLIIHRSLEMLNDSAFIDTGKMQDKLQLEFPTYVKETNSLLSQLQEAIDNPSQLYTILTSSLWISKIQIILCVHTTLKISIIYSAVEHHITKLFQPRHQSIDLEQWNHIEDDSRQYLDEFFNWKKQQQVKSERRRTHARVLFKQFQKVYLQNPYLQPQTRWKLSGQLDDLGRRMFLKPDVKPKDYSNKVNKKSKTRSNVRSTSIMIASNQQDEISQEDLNLFDKVMQEDLESTTLDPEEETEGSSEIFFQDQLITKVHDFKLNYNITNSHNDMVERICINYNVYGNLEISQKLVIFQCRNQEKPNDEEHFGSGLKVFEKLRTYERCWTLEEVQSVWERRFIHRNTAIEIFIIDGRSFLFNCFTHKRQQNFIRSFMERGIQVVTRQHRELQKWVQLWVSNRISNFEYLSMLNNLSSRSFNDIGQYPVFPWILTVYNEPEINLKDESNYRDLSLPLGALREEGRAEAARRFEMLRSESLPAFHYGSHYSNSGIVAHFLIRIEPFTKYAVKLQGGFFDVADRLFQSIGQSWEGSLTHSSDYKELVPEFFTIPEIFTNLNKLNMGQMQSGIRVGDVKVPYWAITPENFIRIHQKALEQPYICRNLHKWIDLIFGHKQQGYAARECFNIFCPFTYEKQVQDSLEDYDDPSIEGIIHQIVYFGQTPIQLFTKPHPPRENQENIESVFDQLALLSNQECIEPVNLIFTERITSSVVAMFLADKRLILVLLQADEDHGDKSQYKIILLTTFLKNLQKSETYFKDELEGISPIFANQWPCKNIWKNSAENRQTIDQMIDDLHFYFDQTGNLLYSGFYLDNSFKIHSLKAQLLRSVSMHSSPVTCLVQTNGYLVTGGFDCAIYVWQKINNELIIKQFPIGNLLGHSSSIFQISASNQLLMTASMSIDGTILLHDIRTLQIRRQIISYEYPTTSCIQLSNMGYLAVCVNRSSQYQQDMPSYYIDIYKINNQKDGIRIPFARDEFIYNMKFSQTGDYLITAGQEYCCVYDVVKEENNFIAEFKAQNTVIAVTVSNNDDYFLFAEHTMQQKADTRHHPVKCVMLHDNFKKQLTEKARELGIPKI